MVYYSVLQLVFLYLLCGGVRQSFINALVPFLAAVLAFASCAAFLSRVGGSSSSCCLTIVLVFGTEIFV